MTEKDIQESINDRWIRAAVDELDVQELKRIAFYAARTALKVPNSPFGQDILGRMIPEWFAKEHHIPGAMPPHEAHQ